MKDSLPPAFIRLFEICAGIIAGRATERRRAEAARVAEQQRTEDAVEVAKLLISRAEATLVAFNQAADHNDNRAIGLIAIILAGAGFIAALRDSLQPYWWVPLIGLGASVV